MYKRILCYLLTLVLTAASFVQPVRAAEANEAGMKTIYVVDKITKAYGNLDIVYTKNGLIKKITPDSIPGATKFTYNKENQLVKKEVLTGEFRPVTTYTYGKTGKVKKAVSKVKETNTKYIYDYSWSQKKNKSIVKIQLRDDNFNHTLTLGEDKRVLLDENMDTPLAYKYDKNGRIKSYTMRGTVFTYKYTLTKHGNIKKMFYTYKTPSGTQKSMPTKFHYKKIKVPKDTYDLVMQQQRYLTYREDPELELLYG